MSKVMDFVKNEIEVLSEEKSTMEAVIHRMKIDIEITDAAINKIMEENDNTNNVFYSGMKNNFNSKEIELLLSQKRKLIEVLEGYQTRIEYIESRLEYLESIRNEIEEENVKKAEEIDSLAILEIQEKERQRIARDIHDSVVQNITALIHKVEFVMRVVDTDVVRAKLELEVVNKIIRECIEELRGIIFDLRPMSLDDFGLEVTLKRCIQQLSNSTDMDIFFEFDDGKKVIAPLVSITILRIIQELCSNSIKYSKGSTININMNIDESNIYITHADNGTGFDEDSIGDRLIHENTGFGISMLRERISLLKGSIRKEKLNQDGGTKYYIVIPYQVEEKFIC